MLKGASIKSAMGAFAFLAPPIVMLALHRDVFSGRSLMLTFVELLGITSRKVSTIFFDLTAINVLRRVGVALT